ncbi:DUF4350 domain-containing protein [Nesterenkonia ebinurensis]|uniref:DUF4350 domain-containing protein n=1 Tax=Nesterenkonia ebinurensis TaxID=2608252 RepID=UPI00123CA76E|nr:DUF4350 domain-containing protein [Nesterenkonia ebinurensis]
MTVTAASAGSVVRSAASRWQFWVFLLVGVLIVGLLTQLLETSDTETYGTQNTDLDGYAALANVLADHGVEIRRTYSAEVTRDLLAEQSDAGVVVMVRGFQPEERFVDELRAEWENGRQVLWLSSETTLLSQLLGPAVQSGQAIPTGAAGTPQELEAGSECAHPAAEAAESVQSPGRSLQVDTGCFPMEDGESFVLAETESGMAFTAPEAFTNQRITDAGNAALALGLLGGSPAHDDVSSSLIWYTPSGADTVGADQWDSPLDHLPGWFWQLFWWLLLCAGVATFAAGRRYGPVVSEPMPVSVPAGESAEGRGRMYQRANAVAETAQVLRSAHLLRLSRLLRLGRGADPQAIAEAAARAAGADLQQVTALLQQPEIQSNDDLVSYAQALAGLEEEVTAAVRMRRSHE